MPYTGESESAVASISHKVTIEPNISVKVRITTKMFLFKGKSNNIMSFLLCYTELPIWGKYQTVTFGRYGKSHILIDNPLDIPVALPQGTDKESLEPINLGECAVVHSDRDCQPLSAAQKSSSSSSPEKGEFLTNAVNEQLYGALHKRMGVSSSFHLTFVNYWTQYVSESTHYN